MTEARPETAGDSPQELDPRGKLLAAGEKLFSTRGFANTRIAEIAAAADTGISTFYRHFPTKSALLGARISERVSQLRQELQRVRLDVEHRPPAEQIEVTRRCFEIGFDALVERPRFIQMLLTSGFGSSEAVRLLVERLIAEAASDVVTVLERLEQTEGVQIPAKGAIAHAAIGGLMHLAYTHVSTGEPQRGDAVTALSTMFIGGVAAANPAWALGAGAHKGKAATHSLKTTKE